MQPLVRTASYENRVEAAVQKASQRVRRQSCDAAMHLTHQTAPKLPPHARPPPNSQGVGVGVKALPPTTTVPEYTRAKLHPHEHVAVTPLAAHGAAQQRVREHKRKQAEEMAAQTEQEALRAQKMQTDQQTAVHQSKLAARRLVLRKMMKEESKMAFLMARASADSRVSATAAGVVDATPTRSRRGSISQKEQAEEKRRLGWSSDEKKIRASIRWQGARHLILAGIRIKHAAELAAERKAKADAEREGVLRIQIDALKAEANMLLANNEAGKVEDSSVINGNVSGGILAVGA